MAFGYKVATFRNTDFGSRGHRPGAALREKIGTSALKFVVLAALLGASHAALAQGAPDGDPADGDEDAIIITGEKKDTYDVLPDRATASVFGTTRSLAETPRSVTLIEASLIDLYGVRTVNDFVNVTAGTFTGNYFGVAGALDVRGERADNFFRGFRRIENRGNFPTAVTASDFVEIIKGPPPVIYGGGKVGGILNFVPKSGKTKNGGLIPRFTGEVQLIGGTYGKKVANGEVGTPFSIGGMASSIYISGQLEDSKHYYHNIYNKNRLIQAALNTDVSETVRLEYGGMYQNADLNQSLGWNRVTQQLVDTDGGSYLSGRATLNLNTNGDQWLSPSEVNAYALEQFAFANPFPYGALTANQKAAYAITPTGFKAIDHRTVQAETIDFSKSKVTTSYFDVVWSPSEDVTIKNQSFFDYMDHVKYSSYGFTAKYKIHVFENKTTASFKVAPSESFSSEIVAGASWRISDGREQESRGRGYQVLDRRDISFGATPNDRFEGAYTGEGSGNIPYNWDQQGRHTDIGLFALFDTRIGDRASLILGGRMDRYHVTVRGTDLNAVYSNASASETAWSYNASFSYALVKDINAYITHAKSSYVELGQGGVVDVLNVAGGTWVQDSDMTEAGIKGYLDNGSLFFNILAYRQQKSAFNAQANQFDYYKSRGIEIEARYALTQRLSLTSSATIQNTKLLNAPFFLGIPPGALGLNPAQTYGGRFTGVGALIGFNGPTDAPTPKFVASLDGTYTNPGGWGFSVGATHVASMFAGYAKAVLLPSYNTFRAAAFYRYKQFEARVNVNNVTNTKYYTPQFLFWDVFVSPSIGRTAELTLTMKW